MASDQERMDMAYTPPSVPQQAEDPSVAVDMPESSVDDIPADEYSDDNIDDIGVRENVEEEEEEEEACPGYTAQEDAGPQQYADNVEQAEAAQGLEGEGEGGEEGELNDVVAVSPAGPEEAGQVEEEEVAQAGVGEEAPSATSTPKDGKKAKAPGKTFKQRLGEIPARLSKISILNALRSGTYVVNEPPPPPPSAQADSANDDDNAPRPAAADTAKMTDNGVVANEDTAEVTMTKMPEETIPEAETMPELPPLPCRKPHSVHRSALTKLLCGLYALMLVVFGIVFAVATSLTVKEREHLYYLEVFQLYLYLGSLATLLYFQLGILRGKQVRNAYLDNSIRVIIRRSQDNIQLSPSPARREHAPSVIGREMEDKEVGLEPRKEPLDQMSTLSNASDFRSHLVLPPDGQVAHVGEGINFYLRFGCLAFSIGSVTLDGFHIASYFETENTTTCESHVFILVYVSHLIFTFVQTFFLFKNHKLVIDKNKASVRFGLMHLLATNLCVWFITAVTETAEDYRQQDYITHRNLSDPPALKSCYEDMTLARTASPYLFPCTIIYSIIAAGIVYRMYTYVGVKVKQRWPSHTSLTSSAAPPGVVSMDCEKANKGLFSGLLVAVITLIAIATFFVFDSRLNNPTTAIKVFFIMEISLLVLTGGCIIVGSVRFQKLRFLENYLSLDSVLLLVSLAGAYIYLCFMLISSASTLISYGVISVLSLVTIAVGLVQSTLQAIFILDGLCRRADNDTQVEAKPGRAVVTFLLVCNLALWVVTLFEIRKTIVVPFHLGFYGILPWNIILHMCVPLYIYFRFHSAICLSKIWFNAYQKADRS